MATAEHLALSLQLETRGVHVLLWDDKDDLVRALLVLCAVLRETPLYPILVPTTGAGLLALGSTLGDDSSGAQRLSVLFVPQAASSIVGPWLNGMRRPLADPPGTLLVVRSADFESLQRAAPDLASFVGPRIYDASILLSMVSTETYGHIHQQLPDEMSAVLAELPGLPPPQDEIDSWLASLPPDASNDRE